MIRNILPFSSSISFLFKSAIQRDALLFVFPFPLVFCEITFDILFGFKRFKSLRNKKLLTAFKNK